MPAGRHNRPTLKTIAEICGLAVPTVSRALSDAPDIGAETKERVRQVAQAVGYVPNRAGVRLKTGKTNVIALVLSTEHGIVNRTARLISSAASALRGTRYHLNVTPYFPDEDPMTPIRYIVETRSADVIILNQTEPRDPRIAYLLEEGFPFVTHGRTDWSDRHSYYDFDNHAFTAQAITLLAAKGRRKILVIAPDPRQTYAQDILRAVAEANAAGEAEVSVLPDAYSDDPDERIFSALLGGFEDRPEIDAIVACSTPAAMVAAAAIEATGRAVGADIALVAKEASRLLHLFRPEIISYFEDISRAGTFLAGAAIAAVETPDRPPAQFMQVPTLEEFESGVDIFTARSAPRPSPRPGVAAAEP